LNPENPDEGSIWIFEDITERKRAEEAIRRSEERFRQVSESAEEWIWEVDLNGLYTFANPIVEKILGYKPDEIIGKKYFYDFFVPESKEFLKEFVLNIFSQKQTISKLENPNLHKNGNIVYLETTGFPILEESGKLIGYRGADRDITEQKLMEDGLRKSERKIRSIYAAVPAGIGFENYKRFIEVNDHFCEMVGYSKEEILEKETRIVYPSDSEYNAVTFLTYKLLEEKGTSEIETRWQKKDGTIINVLLCLETLEIGNTYTGVAFAALDITERIRSEEELKRREKEFRLIWENSVDGMRLTDENGTVIMVNESFCKLVDMKKEDIEGKPLSYVYKNERHKHIVFQHKKRFATRTVATNIERKLTLWNGQEKWLHISNTFFESSGNRLLLLAVFRDVTNRKLAEIALKESEERFRSLYENATIGLYRTTPDGKIILSNSTLVKMLGYNSFEELITRNVKESGYVNREIREEFKRILEERNEITGFETEWYRKDGSIVYIREGARAVRNEAGSIIYYDGTVEDVTERKKTEIALQESEERYRKLVASVPDIILRTDLNGNILFINDEISFISPAISVDTVIGKNMLSFVIDEDKKTAVENMKLMFEKPLGIKEYRIKLDDGTAFVCELNGDVLRDSQNRPTGMVFVMRDITKRKEIEHELENYRQHLEELIKNRTNELETVNKLLQEEVLKQIEAEKKVKDALEKEKELSYLKTKFISIASHEFRTPLTTVLSSTELLERYGRNWEVDKYNKQTERIKKSVNYLTHLMDDVLIISRADSGKTVFNPKPVEFKKFCQSIVDEMKMLLKENHELEFSYDVDKNILFVDEKLLKHILNNLISNAIKYSVNGGKILFEVMSRPDELQFIISDSGIGIPEEDQTNLFEPFNRGKNVKDIHGTGLGMSIVKRSVDMHKGTILFTSKVGIGTTFKIKIPI
jgi:PAS domain S-box-containing protein